VDNDNVETTIEALSSTDVGYDGSVLTIKDVKVSSLTKSGYYSSITTDFVINLPTINLGFSDTEVKNWDEFFKFAVVADGYQSLSKSNPLNTIVTAKSKVGTITVNGNGQVTSFNGSVFAGSSSESKKNSLNLSSGSDINVASANFICAGPVSMVNANVHFVGLGKEPGLNDVPWMLPTEQLRNYGLLESHETSIGLRLFANSLVTNQPVDANGVVIENARVNLEVQGDCIIADDLEINANNSNVHLAGNYFGYGFLATAGDKQIEKGSALGDELGNVADMKYEHESRSAIIVNGKNANVILEPSTYEDVVILGGRAYIDLINGQGRATYMTGESVSVKGNQKVYKASMGMLGEAVRTNPCTTHQLIAEGVLKGPDANNAYQFKAGQLSKVYDSSKVVAKLANGQIYFYRKPTSGIDQTNYFYNTMTEDFAALNDVKAQVANLGVNNLLIGTSTNPFAKVYSVGVMTQVENTNVKNYHPANGIGANAKITDGFYTLIEEMRYRYASISAKLQTFPDYMEYGVLPVEALPTDSTIYSYFISEPKIRTFLNSRDRYFVENVFDNTSIPAIKISELCADTLGKSAEEVHPQILVIDNAKNATDAPCVIDDSESADVRSKFGVVLATGDVVINQDFTGIVICGGNVTINNGATLTACAPLAKFLSTYDKALQLLFGNLGGNAEDDNVIDMSALEYQNIVSCENWRKNYSEIN
jgi:hypothetical protein